MEFKMYLSGIKMRIFYGFAVSTSPSIVRITGSLIFQF